MTEEEMTNEEFIACINRANPEWLARIRKEERRILYDYESDIFCVRFGTDHKFGYLFAPETVNHDIDIKIEEDGLRIIGVDVMYFRKDFLTFHAELSAAFDALCLKHGKGDLFLDLSPYSRANEGDAAHTVADLLSKIADGLILS